MSSCAPLSCFSASAAARTAVGSSFDSSPSLVALNFGHQPPSCTQIWSCNGYQDGYLGCLGYLCHFWELISTLSPNCLVHFDLMWCCRDFPVWAGTNMQHQLTCALWLVWLRSLVSSQRYAFSQRLLRVPALSGGCRASLSYWIGNDSNVVICLRRHGPTFSQTPWREGSTFQGIWEIR